LDAGTSLADACVWTSVYQGHVSRSVVYLSGGLDIGLVSQLILTRIDLEMQDIVSQMVLKWARFGPNEHIDASDDFTRLTLDSIAV
jgi:hypothetical protein